MADVRVRFVGDLGNLQQFDQSIRNSASSAKASFESANRALGESVGPLSGGKNSAGLLLQNSRLVVDSLNNTFRQSTDIVRRYLAGYKEVVNQATGQTIREPVFNDLYVGKIDRAVGNVQKYMAAVQKLAPAEQRINEIIAERESLSNGVVASIGVQRNELAKLQADLRRVDTTYGPQARQQQGGIDEFSPANEARRRAQLQAQIDAQRTRILTQPFNSPREVIDAQNTLNKLTAQYDQVPGIFAQARAGFHAGLTAVNQEWKDARSPIEASISAVNGEIKTGEQELERLATRAEAGIERVRVNNKNLFAAAQIDANTRPLPPQLDQLFQSSPQLLKVLQKQGLGVNAAGVRTNYGTGEFTRVVAQQGVEVESLVRDITKGETQLRVAFSNLGKGPGLLKAGMQQATVAIADNGNVITKWAGILSGSNNLITQFGRNVQRSFGYLISGALTFGSVALLAGAINNVNELDANLQRLGITAQTSGNDTKALFTDLSRIALETATPIEEVVSAADDIALAVRKAGQSTDDYRKDIISLTEAVGIFTNLTGTDTVTATDLLSSSFKQLNVGPEELVGILSKVTAVAGGQSRSIQDIAEGLGGVASAAKAGNLNVNQMIGTLQVLSQVTAKSPAEVAVAFKNLIGSLGSPAALKELKALGIATKDSVTGGLRNIIDIYKDISDQIATGRIKPGDVQSVLRAISGGPRRAPDAAALLDNINRVLQEETIAANATNEALVANARILDTNTAKVTEFQNALKITFYNTFGPAIKDITANLATLGTALLGITNALPPGLIAAGIQIAALLGSFALLKKLLGSFAVPIFQGLKQDLMAIGNIVRSDTTAFERGAIAELEYKLVGTGSNQRYRNIATGKFVSNAEAEAAIAARASATEPSGGRGGLAKLLIGGAAIAGVSAIGASGSNDTRDTIGQLLQIGGTISLLIPGFELLGVAATVAGIAIGNMGSETKKTEATTVADKQATIASIQAYQQQQVVVKGLTDTHEILGVQIENLRAKKKLDAKDTVTLMGLQDQYGKNTIDLIQANQDLAKSFEELGNVLGRHTYQIDILKSGKYNADQLKAIKDSLAEDILRATSPDFAPGGKFAGLSSDQISKAINSPFEPFSQGTYNPPTGLQNGLNQKPFNPADAENTLRYLAPFVDPTTKQLNPYVDAQGHLLPPGIRNDTQPPPGVPNYGGQATQNLRSFIESFGQDLQPYFKWAESLKDAPFLPQNADIFQRGRNFLPYSGSLDAVTVGSNKLPVDLAKIANGAQNIGDVFDSTGKKVAISFEPSRAAIDAVQQGIDLLKKSNPQLAEVFQKTWTDATAYISSYDYVLSQVAAKSAALQAEVELGIISPDDAKKVQAIYNLQAQAAEVAQQNVGKYNIIQGPGDRGAEFVSASSQIESAAQRLASNPDSGYFQREYADTILKNSKAIEGQGTRYDELKAKGTEALRAAEAYLISNLDLTQHITTATGDYVDELAKAARQQELITLRVNAANNEATSNYAQRALKIQQDEASGAYKYAPKGRYQADIAQNEYLYKSQKKLNDEVIRLYKADPANLRKLEQHFRTLPGLEDATTLSAEDFVSRIIQIGISSGLSADQMDPIIKKVIGLGAAILATPSYKAIDIVVTTTYQEIQSGQVTPAAGIGHLTDITGSEAGALGAYAAAQTAEEKRKAAEKAQEIADEKARQAFLDAILHPKLPPLSSYTKPKAPKEPKVGPTPGLLDLSPDILKSEQEGLSQQPQDIATIIRNARNLQAKIPGQVKRDKDSIVEILDGTKRIAEVRGVSEELLRKSMDELADIEKKRLDFDTKADAIRRIRVGSGSFAAIANVPFNNQSGVSVGGPNGPVNVNLNMSGQVLTPAQFDVLANRIAAVIKRQIATG